MQDQQSSAIMNFFAGNPSMTDIVKKVCSRAKVHWKTLAGFVVILLPFNIAIGLFGGSTEGAAVSAAGVAIVGLCSLAQVVVSFLISIAIVQKMADFFEEKEIPVVDSLRGTTPFVLPLIWVSIITGVFLLGLFFLLVIPAIIFGLYWAFVTQTVILEGKTGREALRASKAIVYGRWWETLGMSIVIPLILFVVASVVLIPVFILMLVLSDIPVVFYALGGITDAVYAIVSTMAVTAVYYKLKSAQPAMSVAAETKEQTARDDQAMA